MATVKKKTNTSPILSGALTGITNGLKSNSKSPANTSTLSKVLNSTSQLSNPSYVDSVLAQKAIAANKASNKTSSNGRINSSATPYTNSPSQIYQKSGKPTVNGGAPVNTSLMLAAAGVRKGIKTANNTPTPTNSLVSAAAAGINAGLNAYNNKNTSTTTAKKPTTGTGSSSSSSKTPVGSGVYGNLSSAKIPSASGNSSVPNFNYNTNIDKIIANLQAQYAPKEVTPYQSAYENQINSIVDQIMNREAFSYDMNADPLYQQYKDQYTKQGEQAMKNSIAEAAALTGGYGNSYAETAGNQAYQSYLGKLNEVIPQLYQIAYGQYQDEGNSLYNKLDMYSGLDQSDYTKYLNDVSQTNLENSNAYEQLRDRISDAYNLEDYNYQRYSDSYNAAVQKAELERQAALEAQQLALQQLQADRDYNLSLQQLAAEQAAAKSSASASSSEARADLVNDYYKEMKALLDAEDIENPGNYRNSIQKVYGLIESATGNGILTADEANELLFRLGITEGDMSKILGTDGKYYSLDQANTLLNAAAKNFNRVSNILGLGSGTYEKLYRELMKL